MRVDDVMTEDVFTVTRDTPLKVVAQRMLEYGISGMPVVDGDRVLGVISETDILFKERTSPDRKGLLDWLAHYGEDPPLAKLDARTAGQAMTTPAVTITWGRSVAEAATLMLDLGIDRLPVVHDGRLIGIVTRADLVRAFIRDDREIESEIRDGIVRRFWISLAGLKIAVDAGNVVLEGEVDTQELAESLAEHVRRTPGVVGVTNELTWPGKRAGRRREPQGSPIRT
jgi:CBS domain-containing protein